MNLRIPTDTALAEQVAVYWPTMEDGMRAVETALPAKMPQRQITARDAAMLRTLRETMPGSKP